MRIPSESTESQDDSASGEKAVPSLRVAEEEQAQLWLSSILRREGEIICKGPVVGGLFFLTEPG